jgi:hypothetical protein
VNGGAKRGVVVTGSVYDGDAFSATLDSRTMINISCFFLFVNALAVRVRVGDRVKKHETRITMWK